MANNEGESIFTTIEFKVLGSYDLELDQVMYDETEEKLIDWMKKAQAELEDMFNRYEGVRVEVEDA